jgi:hypothetical protein
VTVATAREEIEVAAGELAGRRLTGVRYYTMPSGVTDKPAWDQDVAHVMDYGLDLLTPEGTTGITWTGYGEFGYGLDLVRGPVLAVLDRAGFCSVGREAPWAAVLAEPITRTQVHWLDVRWGDQDTAGPVALTLRFADSIGIAIVCGSWSGPAQPVFATGDDIVVPWQQDILPVLVPFLPADLLGP